VPRDREGEFVTEFVERYKQMTGDVEEAVLEMRLSEISVRRVVGIHRRPQPREGRQVCGKLHHRSSRRGAEELTGALA
jgi:hypothetical protein